MVINSPLHEPSANIRIHQRTFLRYLDDFNVVQDEQALFQKLAKCNDVVPWEAAHSLRLPPGATYADAVKLLSSFFRFP